VATELGKPDQDNQLPAGDQEHTEGVRSWAGAEQGFPSGSLEQRIAALKAVAVPLAGQRRNTPLLTVIARIGNLPDSVTGIEVARKTAIEQEVRECERILAELSCPYVAQIITRPRPSRIFRILHNADRFQQQLAARTGDTVELPDGRTMTLDEQVVQALGSYSFSIGSPPVTPQGVRVLEEIVLGGSLSNIARYRDLLAVDPVSFDRLLTLLQRLIDQSTRYTTTAERAEFLEQAVDLPGFEGARGLLATVVTGDPLQLIRDRLFSSHRDGSAPYHLISGVHDLRDPVFLEQLISEMTRHKGKLFILRVTGIGHNTFSDEILQRRWRGVIGRLLLVDMSLAARKTNVFLVYTLQPAVIDALQTFHVKEYGTPANTQLTLRLLLAQIPAAALQEISERLLWLVARLRRETGDPGRLGIGQAPVRARRWQVNCEADCRMLEQLHQLLQLLLDIHRAPDLAPVEQLGKQLATEVAHLSRQYFYRDLEKHGYQVVCVPEGGGRRLLGLIARHLRDRLASQQRRLLHDQLPACWQRLATMKQQLGISIDSSQASHAGTQMAVASRRDPDAALLESDEPGLVRRTGHRLSAAARRRTHLVLSQVEDGLDLAAEVEASVTSLNLPGLLHHGVVRCLQRLRLAAGAKQLERRAAGAARRLWHTPLDWLHRWLGSGTWRRRLATVRHRLEPVSIALAETMLQALEGGTWTPILVLPEVGWTFDDVFVEDDFPEKSCLTLALDDQGRPDYAALEHHLQQVREQLAPFPELFALYCASIILIVNDPHNPTSRVTDPSSKLALLHLAADYGLTVVADEAYHKLVASDIKERHGDLPLASFYEHHRRRFRGPVTIYTALPTTKWAIAGGRRTGIIASNDHSTAGADLAGLVARHSGPGNLLSLYLDLQTLQVGLTVKTLCRLLEPAVVSLTNSSPGPLLDRLLTMLEQGQLTQEPYANRLAPVLRLLVSARNQVTRLALRDAGSLPHRRLLAGLVTQLKEYRLEKLTRRDITRRTTAIRQALERAGFGGRFIVPEGPFYVCICLDPAGDDPSLQPFLEAMALCSSIDAVPVGKGWIRFSFGGRLDGSAAGYELLGLALETDLRLLLPSWQRYQELRSALNAAGDSDPEAHALRSLLAESGDDLPQLLAAKEPLITRLLAHRSPPPPLAVVPFQPAEHELLGKIEPGSPATVVTVPEADCQDMQELLQSRTFAVLYHYLISRAAASIPELRQLSRNQLLGRYGAEYCRARFADRQLEEQEYRLFQQLLLQAARLWFSAGTIKVLAATGGQHMATQPTDALLGRELRVGRLVLALLRAFVPLAEEHSLSAGACFQVGYLSATGIGCDPACPGWLQRLVAQVELASVLVPTDEAPDLVTGGTRRAGGHALGIFRRDGDGCSAPLPEYFRSRLELLTEVVRPRDYLLRLLQVGPTRILVVLHRAYTHYLGEELRLFPQLPIEQLLSDGRLAPDGVAFLGIPSKVMGDCYRIGYFFDCCNDGRVLPVSWVSAGDDTDYMGYFKKPILTLHNEIVAARGGLPVHGSLLTITLRNGLRKTIVLAGDSGTGKSELLIAMSQQMIDRSGQARNIESLELLAGDMLSLFIGEDGQLYAFGTESGDFLRMTDIPDSWQHRFRDRIATASTTNRLDARNPRTTIGGLCEPHSLLAPTRVNLFFVMDNFSTAQPGGRVLVEEEPENLLLQVYPAGYRREKGTSGDQPNLRASLLYSDHPLRHRLLVKYQEQLDTLLGWHEQTERPDLLAFQDLPGGPGEALQMVRDLFVGRRLQLSEPAVLQDREGAPITLSAGSSWSISRASYEVLGNRFELQLRQEATAAPSTSGDTKLEALLDRALFDRLLPPIASTFCGNPFIDPQGLGLTLQRFGRAMRDAEVITGIVSTQLAVPGREHEGPARASQHLISLIQEDYRINARFQRNKARVYHALQETYGRAILGPVDLPVEIQAVNLLELERFESDSIRLVDAGRGHIDLVTPYYRYSSTAATQQGFQPRLLHPEIGQAIHCICDSPDFDIPLHGYVPDLAAYDRIRYWRSQEELLYQVLLVHGDITLGHGPEHLFTAPATIRKAQRVAKLLRQQRRAVEPPPTPHEMWIA
jgi:hypothetical protein